MAFSRLVRSHKCLSETEEVEQQTIVMRYLRYINSSRSPQGDEIVNRSKQLPLTEREQYIVDSDEYWDQDNYLVDYKRLPKDVLKYWDEMLYEANNYTFTVIKPNNQVMVREIPYEEKETIIAEWQAYADLHPELVEKLARRYVKHQSDAFTKLTEKN